MPRQRRWVFESRAPIEDFAQRVRLILRSRGWPLEEAEVFDFAAKVGGLTVYFAFRYHHRGLEATVKVKGGLLADPDPVHDDVFEVLRTAQLELAGRVPEGARRRAKAAPSQEAQRHEPDEAAGQAGPGGASGPERDDGEEDAGRRQGEGEEGLGKKGQA